MVFRVFHRNDAPAQRFPSGTAEQGPEKSAKVDCYDLPACRVEHCLESVRSDVGYHSVQGLAVEVDDPDDFAEFGDPGIQYGLPYRTLVEFGVADQRVLPTVAAGIQLGVDVTARHGPPDRGGCPDPD